MDHGWRMSEGRGWLLEASVHDEELGPKGFGGQRRRPVMPATIIVGPSCEKPIVRVLAMSQGEHLLSRRDGWWS